MYGDHLEDLLKERHITQTTLSKETGVSASVISDFINGKKTKRGLTQAMIIKICKYLNVSADWLLGLVKYPSIDPNLKAVCEYTGLNEKAIEELRSDDAASEFIYRITDTINTLLSNEKGKALLVKMCKYLYTDYSNIYMRKGNEEIHGRLFLKALSNKYIGIEVQDSTYKPEDLEFSTLESVKISLRDLKHSLEPELKGGES